MFTKFGQLRSKNIVNPANESQVYSVILKALGLVEPLNNKIQLPFSSPILHDAYGVAMKSPYGFVIRQIIEGNILLALMHEIVIVLRKEIEITEKELKELQEEYESTEKNEDGNGAHKTHRTQEALHSEILTKEEKLDNLKTVSTEYSEFQPHCRNQLSILNAKYIAAIGRDIESAKTEVVERARELGYELNEEEKAIITSMVPIEELREKLLASYQQANAPTHQQTVADPTQSSHSDSTSEHFQIPAAPAPPPVSTPFEAPSGAYLAARRLPDLELRTMMTINANWNRQVHDMMNAPPAAASIPHTPGTTPIPDQETSAQMPPQERTELSALRAEFKAK